MSAAAGILAGVAVAALICRHYEHVYRELWHFR